MRTTADIAYGVAGQLLRLTVRAGRPTAATFAVFAAEAGDDDTPEFGGAASVDSVSTTLLAAAGPSDPDPTAVSLVSVTGVVAGRLYLVQEGGLREWVRPVQVDGDTVFLGSPLQNDYSTAATWRSCDLTAAVDDTWAADSAHLSDPGTPDPGYRVRWAVTVDGAEQVHVTFFDLARVAVGHGVTMHDVEARLWNVLEDVPVAHRGDQGQRIIDAAWEDVQALLAGQRVNDASVRDAALIDQLLLKQIRLTFAINGFAPRGMAADLAITLAREDLQRFFERHFVAGQVPMAESSGSSKKKSFRGWVK